MSTDKGGSLYPEKPEYGPHDFAEAMAEFAARYKDPENWLNLLHGQDAYMNAAIKQIAGERILSAFPSREDGTKFLMNNITRFCKEYGIDRDLSWETASSAYGKLLLDLFTGEEKMSGGGLETRYIRFDQPPQTQSYEYIGEILGRSIRSQFYQDKSLQTKAFFGWVGRHIFKKICPETDFSFDRHNQMADEEKNSVLKRLDHFVEMVKKGAEGQQALETYKIFFASLAGELFDDHIHEYFDSCNTPLESYAHHQVEGYDDYMSRYLDQYSSRKEGTFESFWEGWQSTAKTKGEGVKPEYEGKIRAWESFDAWRERMKIEYRNGTMQSDLRQLFDTRLEGLKKNPFASKFNWSKVTPGDFDAWEEDDLKWHLYHSFRSSGLSAYQRMSMHLREEFPSVFDDILENMGVVTPEQLAPRWYEMVRQILISNANDAKMKTEKFETSYFRFIKNEWIARGYAYAQNHAQEILATLPEVVKMPEGEIQKKFMQGKPMIRNPKGDYYNSVDDLYNRDRFERRPWPEFSDREKRPIETEWFVKICHGPNADLYDQLQQFDFTEEQWRLGIDPLFFGVSYSDRQAGAFVAGKTDEFYKRNGEKKGIDREEKRIEELKQGKFSLPENVDGLIRNADMQIARLEARKPKEIHQRRIRNIQEVKSLLEYVRGEGLMSLWLEVDDV